MTRTSSYGPLVFAFAVARVWAMRHNRPGPPIWQVIRRSLDGKEVWWPSGPALSSLSPANQREGHASVHGKDESHSPAGTAGGRAAVKDNWEMQLYGMVRSDMPKVAGRFLKRTRGLSTAEAKMIAAQVAKVLVQTYEGFQFDLKILDPSEDFQ